MSEKQFTRVNWKTKKRIGEIMTVNIKGLGKIEADESVLFDIASAFRDSSILNSSKGRTPFAILQMEFFRAIHQAIIDSGYYKK